MSLDPRLDPSPKPRRLVAWCVFAVVLHAATATVALSVPVRLGYASSEQSFDDVRLYRRFVAPMLKGRWPYRDYRVEYPILALPVFAAPMAIGGGVARYQYGFVAEMLALDAALVWLIARRVARAEGPDEVPRRLGWYSAFFAALCPMIVLRFDLAPTWLAFAAASGLAASRPGLGGVLAGLGILTKLFPAVVAPAILATRRGWPSRWRGLLGLVLTVGAGGLAWWWLAGAGLAETFRYHGERGLEIESLPASAYIVAHLAAGVPIASRFDHGGVNLLAPGSIELARKLPILQLALLLLVAFRARVARPDEGMRIAAASLLAFVMAGKVLSPQYLIWLAPFVASLGGPNGKSVRQLYLGCCLLTTTIYPRFFDALGEYDTLAVVFLVARNVGLIWLFGLLMARDGGISPPGRQGRGGEGEERGDERVADQDPSHSIVPGGLLVTS